MLNLGNIVYSNCFPPHAGILLGTVAFPFRMMNGIPTELNRLLREGAIDVSPSSSIEYALNPGSYILLPDLSIASKKRVMSILLESRTRIEDLDKKIVALTTASATSVVLLRVLLEVRFGAVPEYIHYRQGEEDPAPQCDAMLTIGDLALTKTPSPGFPFRYDLGELWYEFTGLPFVFALWHVNYKKSLESDLRSLYDILRSSKEYGLSHLREAANSEAKRYGIPADVLYSYWKSFSYDFGHDEQNGLMAYYEYAAKLGVIEPVKELRFWSTQ